MQAEADRVEAMLDDWRELGADRIAPVRFHHIAALQRRAALLQGEARRILDDRIADLLAAYADTVERAASMRDDAIAPRVENSETLATLTRLLAGRAHAGETNGTGEDMPVHARPPRMDVLADARRIWKDVRTHSQVRQSLEQTAEGAGPLNSNRLVHRAIQFMGECAPACREYFLAYVDALSWLQQIAQPGTPGNSRAPAAAGQTQRKPKRTRKPRAASPGKGN